MTVRVLLADDHQMLREALRRTFEEAGMEVVGEAADGGEAVDLAAELQPDVVLMDVTMPVLDGVSATEQVREVAPTSAVVVLTMHADRDVLRRALDAGAVGYLVKDCSTDDIIETVQQAANGASLSPAVAEAMLGEARTLQSPAMAEPEEIISKREEEVLQLIADGLSTQEVAEALFISLKTVKNHLANIYAKLEARDRTQAVVQAVRRGIIRLD